MLVPALSIIAATRIVLVTVVVIDNATGVCAATPPVQLLVALTLITSPAARHPLQAVIVAWHQVLATLKV